ncbi:hypothetical protein SLEP1_g34386 [Rubroshorea leprosula]|uniref:Uncharacterized protein n=1 Tax=Rubroshorea leprosula TaxID=152421 RepID=A0AAV5KJQ6_9ROSI|nr:hypothetical protein SLEP1_g34386 [Rubroshorea leprosula]
MEGKGEEIRKGPWKAEEDAVLINHVKRYGPRDWSSIRSKGLLQRTGKSCRLRWVNKLRPNLKNGCKFTVQEERMVIDLQAQFGNKWARIATYLPGRTDNDVKNFWSSRQKRLARILQNSATPSNSKSQKTKVDSPDMEATKFCSSMEDESSSTLQSCSSSYIDNSETIKMVLLPELVKPNLPSLDVDLTQLEKQRCTDVQLETPFSQPDLTFSLESQELVARFEDSNFSQVFASVSADAPELGGHVPLAQPFFEPVLRTRDESGVDPLALDAFDEFPTDMFDQLDPLQSP